MAMPVVRMGSLRSGTWVFSRCFKTCMSGVSQTFPKRSIIYVTKRRMSQTVSSGERSLTSQIALGVGIGLALGGGYVVTNHLAAPDRRRYGEAIEIDNTDSVKKNTSISPPQDLKISRTVEGPTNLGLELVLFQYQSCPFCCKVRAFLEYYGIPYSIVEVNSLSRSQIKFSKYKKVPILMVKDSNDQYHQLNDSSAIVSILATFARNPKQSLSNEVLSQYKSITYIDEDTKKEVTEIMNRYFVMYGDSKIIDAEETGKLNEERHWRHWVDNHLVHIISPNIYHSLAESKETFEQFSINGHWEETFSLPVRTCIINGGALAMYFIGKKLKKKYKLEDDVRKSLYSAINDWMNSLNGRTFMGGKQPNLADLAVYGVLNSFEGCRAFKDLEKETKVGQWYTDVKSHILHHTGSLQVPKLNENKDILI